MLVASGLDLVLALQSLVEETRSPAARRALVAVRSEVETGQPLWRALAGSRAFSDYVISLIRVGEESGRLAEHLQVVAEQLAKDRQFAERVRSAMMYPLIVLSLTIVVGTGVAWFILPRLATIFTQLHRDLPVVTRVMIASGQFLGTFGWLAVPLFLLAVVGVGYLVFVHPKTKFIGEGLLDRIPPLRRLTQEVELARAGYLFGHLLEAGVPIIESLESLSQATTTRKYRQFYQHLRGSIADGHSFRHSFRVIPAANAIVPTPIQQMIVAGEQSGRLASTWLGIGQRFEAKTETTAKNLAVVIEPGLLVVVWLGVVFVAVAVILPIYSLIGSLDEPPAVNGTSRNVTSQPPTAEANTNTAPPADDNVNVTVNAPSEPEPTPNPPVGDSNENTNQNVTPETPTTPTAGNQLTINQTSTGYLNVRQGPGLGYTVLTRAKPGQTYPWLRLEAGWYEIELAEGQTGWVIGRYVTVASSQEP